MNSPPDRVTTRCELLSSAEQTSKVLEPPDGAKHVALDVEADGSAVGAVLAGISFCFEAGTAYHAPLGPEETDSHAILQELRPVLGADGPPKLMHDAKPGLMVLLQSGVETGRPAFDTLLPASRLDWRAHDRGDLRPGRLGRSADE